jgi:hypothetical protein
LHSRSGRLKEVRVFEKSGLRSIFGDNTLSPIEVIWNSLGAKEKGNLMQP